MKIKMNVQLFTLMMLSLLLVGFVFAEDAPKAALKPETIKPSKDIPKYFVLKPPFTEGIFPCSNCHSGMETNPKRRILKDEHTNIILKHAEKQRWCLDCHNANDRDYLHFTDGRLIPFTESYELCGQCHGNVFRDWKVGIHGKRTGYWNGEKSYRLCVNCHNPHDPKFKELKPEPPPIKPAENGMVKSSTKAH